MRRSTAGLLLMLAGLASPVRAQAPADGDAAVAVVMRQLDAFRRDDFDTAYTFASSTIHEMFNRARFETMVRGGYPEIARSAHAAMVRREIAPNGNIYLRVDIRGTNGKMVDAVYELVWENGAWKINSVVTREVQGVLSQAVDSAWPDMARAHRARSAR